MAKNVIVETAPTPEGPWTPLESWPDSGDGAGQTAKHDPADCPLRDFERWQFIESGAVTTSFRMKSPAEATPTAATATLRVPTRRRTR